MSIDLSKLPIPLTPLQLPGGATIWVPTGATMPTTGTATLPNLAAGAPDLSGLLSALTPLLGAAVPQLAPFLPIIGALFNIARSLNTQMQGTAPGSNPSLELVNDAFFTHILQALAPQPAASTTATH